MCIKDFGVGCHKQPFQSVSVRVAVPVEMSLLS